VHRPLVVCVQLPPTQASVVQMLPSSQLIGVPTHAPPEQTSVVQACPSSQGFVLFTCVQPVPGLHPSVVQTLPSSQFGAGPPTQTPPLQASLVVQALPSLQELVLLACVQPLPGLHPSVVQTLLSSQLGAGPPTHVPPLHVSLVVHAFPSSQKFVLFTCVQPVPGLHPSVVQTLPSSQFGAGPPTHVPPLQASLVVQALPSSQELVLLACVQPVPGLHPSVVQMFPSSQLGAGPPTQVPPLHVSLVVHAFPSLQEFVLFACVQPVPGLHPSVVQTLLSSQFGAEPPTQLPPAQVSFVVHALPSLQGFELLVCVQPLLGLHPSVVQTLLSSQFGAGPPTQLPPEHVSPVVHALPSLHAVPFGALGLEHRPVSGSQTPATWQESSAVQTTSAHRSTDSGAKATPRNAVLVIAVAMMVGVAAIVAL
jgi:hypothetical protein